MTEQQIVFVAVACVASFGIGFAVAEFIHAWRLK